MGGGASKEKSKKKQQKHQSEAKAAEVGVKAGITGTVQQCNFHKYYEWNDAKQALGTGVTGAVHEWKHKTTGQTVAIKSVKKRGMTADAILSMKQEIQLLAMLDHPNIVKIIEAFEDANSITIVMEICSGGELFDNLLSAASYTQQRAARLFKQMVGAVGYCHKMNVAHRDLKLENFVFETKEARLLKLIDFGLSNRYSGGGIKRMNTLVGTPYYMAPEVLDRQVEYGNECDVWSLGVLLFMMLTGSPPFNGNNERGIMEAVKNNDIYYNPSHWKDMPDAEKLIKQMLQVDMKKRYTCDQVLASKWLNKYTSKASTQALISPEVLKAMAKYANLEKLKKTATQIVAFTLSPDEIKELRALFQNMDKDGSGTLSLAEFRAGMEKHAGMDPKSIEELFSKIDSDHTGLISYSEFISASLSTSVSLTEERLVAAFDKLDPDKSGFIDAHELGNLLKGTVKQPDIDKMIADADEHGEHDGKISKKEFLMFVQSH